MASHFAWLSTLDDIRKNDMADLQEISSIANNLQHRKWLVK